VAVVAASPHYRTIFRREDAGFAAPLLVKKVDLSDLWLDGSVEHRTSEKSCDSLPTTVDIWERTQS